MSGVGGGILNKDLLTLWYTQAKWGSWKTSKNALKVSRFIVRNALVYISYAYHCLVKVSQRSLSRFHIRNSNLFINTIILHNCLYKSIKMWNSVGLLVFFYYFPLFVSVEDENQHTLHLDISIQCNTPKSELKKEEYTCMCHRGPFWAPSKKNFLTSLLSIFRWIMYLFYFSSSTAKSTTKQHSANWRNRSDSRSLAENQSQSNRHVFSSFKPFLKPMWMNSFYCRLICSPLFFFFLFSHGLLCKTWIVPPLGRYWFSYLFIYLFVYLFSSLTFLYLPTPQRVLDRFWWNLVWMFLRVWGILVVLHIAYMLI